VTRIGAATQPDSARTATMLADASSTFISKIHALVEETILLSRNVGNQMANLLIILLTPASMVALVFGLWRIGEDVGWTGTFVISAGFFSHWQVWLALAGALRLLASWLQLHVRARAETFGEN